MPHASKFPEYYCLLKIGAMFGWQWTGRVDSIDEFMPKILTDHMGSE